MMVIRHKHGALYDGTAALNTQLRDAMESGAIALDCRSEKAFVVSLLNVLEIPASSQMLVFSTTSLQMSLISAANPRALYFNEEVYLGYVPGGRIEIAALDPDLGAIFYIFDIPIAGVSLNIERSGRCMNCHAGEDTGQVPGLVIKSVMPGPNGGSLTAYRIGQSGHTILLGERFGGWYVTGAMDCTNHLGNLTGDLSGGRLTTAANPPGQRFQFGKYPVPTSDLLPHLLHEHQVGFVNRVIEATYRTRTVLALDGHQLSSAHAAELEEQARRITRYLLFAHEAPLPPGGVAGDLAYRTAFLKNRRRARDGSSLKDFELNSRLFKHRCSYMIYSSVFVGLPDLMKQRVYKQLRQALREDEKNSEFAYLPVEEKRSITRLLRETISDLPSDW